MDDAASGLGGADLPVRWWPSARTEAGGPIRIAVATVNYNTRDLVAFLVWSVYRFIGSSIGRVVVVDNGSDDGSVELLRACAEASVCELIANDRNRYHGPGLTQAVSYLADAVGNGEESDVWVWLLDSDCVIARGDVIEAANSTAHGSGAALLGESRWDEWHHEERLGTFSLLFDPARVWRPPTEPFVEDGDPARAFELSCRRRPGVVAGFPFSADGYVIHRGRGTLARVERRSERSNRYHAWSVDHHEAHYERAKNAEKRYRDLRREFSEAVGNSVDIDRFLAAVNDLGWGSPPSELGNPGTP